MDSIPHYGASQPEATGADAGVERLAEKAPGKADGLPRTKERPLASRPAVVPPRDAGSAPQSNGAPRYLPGNPGVTAYPSLAGRLQEARKQYDQTTARKQEAGNRPDDHGRMPLMVAAEEGDAQAIRSLLQQGADPDRTDNQGNTALFYAAKGGNQEAVRLLVQGNPALVSLRNNAGETAATVAARNGKASVLAMLIDSRANPYEVSGEKTLLIHALESGSRETVQALVQQLKLRESGAWRSQHASSLFPRDPCEELGKMLVGACASSMKNKCDDEITCMVIEEGRHHITRAGQQSLMASALEHGSKAVVDTLRKLFPGLD